MPNEVKINVTWDDSAALTGMGRTREEAGRLGDDVARDLDTRLSKAGTQAGQHLGENVTRGAEGSISGVRDAAEEAGRDVETSLSDSGQRAGEELETALGDAGTRAGKKLGDNTKTAAASSSKETGSLMAAGIGLGIGLGAPLIAGAMIDGVAAGGIGMIIAAQKTNKQVVDSFTGLKTQVVGEIKDATDQSVPYLVQAGHDMQQTFANLGPQFKQAFSYAGPDIHIMTAGVDALATNAMPGLVSAMKNSYPVMSGTAVLLGKVGTAATTVLTDISTHSQVFGRDLAQTGDLVENLGSVVGGVLPGLATGFGASVGAVNTLLTAVKPIAPALGTIVGYAAPIYGMFNLFGVAARPVQAMGDGLGKVGKQIGDAGYTRFGGTLTTIGKAASGAASSLPLIGAAVGVVSDVIASSDEKFQAWQSDLVQGGDAAKQAMEQFQQQAGFMPGSFDKLFQGLTPVQKAQALYNAELVSGKASASDLASAQNNLTLAVQKEKANQDQQNLALIQANSTMATLTDSILNQENAALGLSGAQLTLTGAESAYNDAVKAHGKSSQEAREAYQQEQQAIMGVVAAAGAKAKADDDEAIQNGKQITASQEAMDQSIAERKEVMNLIGQYALAGKAIPSALSSVAAGMEHTSASAVTTAAEVDNVNSRLKALPPGKKITVDALTSQAEQELEALGYKVTHLKNGKITITAVDNVSGVVNQIVRMNSGKTIRVNVVTQNVATGPYVRMQASGGASSGGTSIMNERGPEAVRLPTGSTVIPAADTARMFGSNPGGSGSTTDMAFSFMGNIDSVMATAIMKLFRQGAIQLTSNGQRVQVA